MLCIKHYVSENATLITQAIGVYMDSEPGTYNSFEQIYDSHYSLIFNYIFKRLGDFDQSKDICSEVFIKAFRSFPRFRYKGIAIKYWLYKIATNEIYLFYRHKQRYQPELLQDIYMDEIQWTSIQLEQEREMAISEMENKKKFRKILQALKTLPLKYQEVISLKYFEGMDNQEISTILGKKPGTIRSLLSRGIKQLKKMQHF